MLRGTLPLERVSFCRVFADALLAIHKTNPKVPPEVAPAPNSINAVDIDELIDSKRTIKSGSFSSSDINKSISALDKVLCRKPRPIQDASIVNEIECESYKAFVKKLTK